ncbi:hypothetical protein AK812_SmicGene26607 [Symbiodinium microadriaticum]|uniref:Uncharacterized protein n=1 Tax=Symbiodinium microadriaticum TaxID=2951 RepID=A0A1Q9D978_SYMMI|nr:hypothetical protein AK812_SmicGene26607 [Symbiodinium microadriaticum]
MFKSRLWQQSVCIGTRVETISYTAYPFDSRIQCEVVSAIASWPSPPAGLEGATPLQLPLLGGVLEFLPMVPIRSTPADGSLVTAAPVVPEPAYQWSSLACTGAWSARLSGNAQALQQKRAGEAQAAAWASVATEFRDAKRKPLHCERLSSSDASLPKEAELFSDNENLSTLLKRVVQQRGGCRRGRGFVGAATKGIRVAVEVCGKAKPPIELEADFLRSSVDVAVGSGDLPDDPAQMQLGSRGQGLSSSKDGLGERGMVPGCRLTKGIQKLHSLSLAFVRPALK